MKKILTSLLTIFMVVACVLLNTNVKVDAKPAESNYLTFTAEEDGSTISFSRYLGDVQIKVSSTEVLIDGTAAEDTLWHDYNNDVVITLTKKGDSVSFKGTEVITDSYHHFSMNGKIAASGDVTSLSNGTGGDFNLTTVERYNNKYYSGCYSHMFDGCTALTTAPSLPSTTLSYGCYYNMFNGCTGLTSTPEFPAITLAEDCCEEMFKNCTSLTSATSLSATTLAKDCYMSMFEGCTSLTTAPKLLATKLAEACYSGMFGGCTSLKIAPELPAETLAFRCYEAMFFGCTSLTDAPKLPASKLEGYCYYYMFQGCTSLEIAPELPAKELASHCYYLMFENCSNLKVAPKLPAEELVNNCYNKMFYKCTSLTVAPELPATTLADDCYEGMFYGCSNLTVAPKLQADTLAPYCYSDMFVDCTSLTIAPELPATILEEGCYRQMFNGCKNLIVTPKLPATVLTEECYYGMFGECTGLVTIPELPATTLADRCYEGMFYGCTGLNISDEKDETHQLSWSIPSTATEEDDWNHDMFDDCGDNVCFSRTTTPVTLTIGTTYYLPYVDFNLATISDISDQTYTGSKIEPELTVSLGGISLIKDSDYTVEYKDNTDVGTATVTINGIGNYTGSKTLTFKIVEEEKPNEPETPVIPNTGIQDTNNFMYVSILTLGVYTVVKSLRKEEC